MTDTHDLAIKPGDTLLDVDGEDLIERALARFKVFDDKHYRYVNEHGGPEAIKVGDRLSWYENRYQHQARMVVTKINRKSIIAYEIEGSYGQGTRWSLYKEGTDWWAKVRHDSSFNSSNIPKGIKIK